MKRFLTLAACLLAALACGKQNAGPSPQPEEGAGEVRILPVMTKVTATSFESGDAVGVSITRSTGAYADNEKMTFDGSVFSGSLKWYDEEADAATVAAYYPYSPAVPVSFTVQADQSAGTGASDLVAGIKEGVVPTARAITLAFKHKLSAVEVKVSNRTGDDLKAVAMKDIRLTARVSADFTASADESAAPGSVVAARTDDDTYMLIVPPQSGVFSFGVTTAGGKELTKSLQEVTLEAGKKYSVGLVADVDQLFVVLSGEIDDWDNGGELGGAEELVEKLSDGYITYQGDKYTVAQMKDGKWWMTQNLRYVPDGFTASDDLSAVTAGVFYPVVVNADQSGAEFSRDAAVIEARGYLYQAECALGLKVGDLTTVEAAQALEGARGICPKGWHVPTGADIMGLVGRSVGYSDDSSAPYYKDGNGSMALLNADGFNMEAFGAVTIQDNTKTSGTIMGFMSSYKEHISSGMFCGSTYAGVTYNTSSDETSGVKNLQFYGLMPMTNKATEAEYTCNGTKVSYRIAGPLRCVRNN